MTGKVFDDHPCNIVRLVRSLMIMHRTFYMTGKVSDNLSWNILHDW